MSDVDEYGLTPEQENAEYLRQNPAVEGGLWTEWVGVVCGWEKIAPPTQEERSALRAQFYSGKTSAESVADLKNLRVKAEQQAAQMRAVKEAPMEHWPASIALPSQPGYELCGWQERQAARMDNGVVTEWTKWYFCKHASPEAAKADEFFPEHIPDLLVLRGSAPQQSER